MAGARFLETSRIRAQHRVVRKMPSRWVRGAPNDSTLLLYTMIIIFTIGGTEKNKTFIMQVEIKKEIYSCRAPLLFIHTLSFIMSNQLNLRSATKECP
jgi:hypothetical protein